jgi:hypothetical protein
MKKAIVILSLGVMTVLFQNCQQTTEFGSVDRDALSKATLTEVVTADNGTDDATGEINQPDEQTDNNTDTNTDDNNTDDPADPTVGKHDDKTPPVRQNEEEPQDDGDGDGLFVCILAGPGKSVKLGIHEGVLAGQHGVGHDSVLCMSRKACLEIASLKFQVKGPYKRGYCKEPGGNPHVRNISDADLAAKVAAP